MPFYVNYVPSCSRDRNNTDKGHRQFPPPTQFLRCCQRGTIRCPPDPSKSPNDLCTDQQPTNHASPTTPEGLRCGVENLRPMFGQQ
ncbi:hypothetical protein EVAR_69569_1 [Eumeta japonica]|uniref:Uncharacterized protein n=1 Tax=Eumeta variegata TaxID=151549 RepID=A0A4C1ZHN1_EUMVA|nr:hypothetical protein EVAR_69569_1 [Eumeta japonica]